MEANQFTEAYRRGSIIDFRTAFRGIKCIFFKIHSMGTTGIETQRSHKQQQQQQQQTATQHSGKTALSDLSSNRRVFFVRQLLFLLTHAVVVVVFLFVFSFFLLLCLCLCVLVPLLSPSCPSGDLGVRGCSLFASNLFLLIRPTL